MVNLSLVVMAMVSAFFDIFLNLLTRLIFSPSCHRFVGKLFVWDWKTSKNTRRFKAHDKGPAIGCVWSPIEPSMVVTCGWDAVIKIWE